MKQSAALESEVVHLIESLLQATRLDLSYTVELHPGTTPKLQVEFSGPDTPLLLERNAEVLHAIEHLGAKVLKLDPDQHDLLKMDAAGFNASRDASLRDLAERAAAQVRETGRPYTFSPMSSHERRTLHLELAASGLHTESVGFGSQRAVVLYPAGQHAADGSPTQETRTTLPIPPFSAAS